MKYKLLGEMKTDGIETVLNNRGIKSEDIDNYLNLNSSCVNDYTLLFNDKQGSNFIHSKHLIDWSNRNDIDIYVIVDCDTDGITSASELMNYLYDMFEDWAIDKVHYIVHEDKSHGIELDKLPLEKMFLLIVPDAGTNDVSQCKVLYDKNIPVIILDHHNQEIDKDNNVIQNPYCVMINNQSCNYPNKQISGVAVVNKFLQYLDKCNETDYAAKYNDLVSLGMISDMQSMAELETKYLIETGIKEIRNPFLKEHLLSNDMKKKSKGNITPSFFAFYVAPYVNAMCRSGELQEKKTLFESFLKYKAYELVESKKRGDNNVLVPVVKEGLRIAKNVKSRQDKNKKSSMRYLLESKIPNESLDKNSVILILNEKEDIDKNIAGLVCNELLPIYQRPVCCLTKVGDDYIGSARGYEKCEIHDFMKFCMDSKVINWGRGHSNAFGLSIPACNITQYLDYCNSHFKNDEPVYYVDFLWEREPNTSIMKQIISLDKVWGTKMSEPLIYLSNVPVTYNRVTIYEKEDEKTNETINTIKITLSTLGERIELIKFYATKEECNRLPSITTGVHSNRFNFVGYCNMNSYRGTKTLQIRLEDFEEYKEEIILNW